MEQNTDRMWWTIGLIVLGGLLISGLVMIANTSVMPQISEKANALINTAGHDVTHTAYSWSSDGTDRFTTTKPNLNLLNNSRLQNGNITTTFFTANGAVPTINSNVKGLNVSSSGGAISFQQGVGQLVTPVFAGNEYTISVKVINTGTVAIDKFTLGFGFFDSAGAADYTSKTFSIPADGKVYSISFTYTAPANTTFMRCYYLDTATAVNVAHNFTIYDMKAEPGSLATPWMPSASEVKPSDQPKYIGTYTDNSKTDSQNPKNYTWKLNPEYHE